MNITPAMQWVWSIALACPAVLIVIVNWVVLFRNLRGQIPPRSGVPFAGGILGAFAIMAAPADIRGWWWVALIMDWGSLPSLIVGLGLSMRRMKP